MFFFDLSTEMSIIYCQYDLGFDPFLAGNGFHYFFFFNLIHIFNDFYNPRINKVLIIINNDVGYLNPTKHPVGFDLVNFRFDCNALTH